LTGTAGAFPQLSLSAASLSFNGQAVGSPGVPQNIILTNTGGAPFYFTYIKSSSSSFVQTNNCGASLAMGASCTISVTFVPSSANFFSGQIDIYDGQDILSYSVLLSATGVDFYLSSSGGASLLAGYSGQFPVTVNVLGGSTYSDSVTLSCSGMPSDTTCGFSPATTQAGFTSQTVNMNISTQFLAPGGTYPLTITGVSANGYSHSQQFLLTIGKPAITLSSSTLTFAAQPVDVKEGNVLAPDPAQRVLIRGETLNANPGRPCAPVSIPGLPIETASGGIRAPQYFAPGVAGDHGEPIAQYIQVGSYLLPNNLSANAHGNGYAHANILVPSVIESVQGYDFRTFLADLVASLPSSEMTNARHPISARMPE
jgi:hypothetical protein